MSEELARAYNRIATPDNIASTVATATVIIIALCMFYQAPCRPYFNTYDFKRPSDLSQDSIDPWIYLLSKHSMSAIGGFQFGMLIAIQTSNLYIRKASMFAFAVITIIFASQVLFYFGKVDAAVCPESYNEIVYGTSITYGYLGAAIGIICGLLFNNVLGSVPIAIQAPTIFLVGTIGIVVILGSSYFSIKRCEKAYDDGEEVAEDIEDPGVIYGASSETLAWVMAASATVILICMMIIIYNSTSFDEATRESRAVDPLFVREKPSTWSWPWSSTESSGPKNQNVMPQPAEYIEQMSSK
jgi:hypothetical protein